MTLPTNIADNLKKDMETTAKLIMMSPESGASMKAVQEKFIKLATAEYEKTNPKPVAKRIAKNNVTELMKYYMKKFQA